MKLVAAAKPAAPAVAAAAGRRGSAMSIAMGKLGAPYRWGAAGPGAFDCSGLVYWSYRQTGMTLPRSSSAQSRVGAAVSKGALQPGDLVFFYRPVSHVAIYIGGGTRGARQHGGQAGEDLEPRRHAVRDRPSHLILFTTSG